MRILPRIIILVVLTMCASGANAQMRRVSTGRGAGTTITIYDSGYVDMPPSFPGGESELANYIISTRCYPMEAYNNGVQGRVVCAFIVNPDGTIDHIRVIKSVEESLDQEAVRIISSMPRWNAGIHDGHAVPVKYVLTIPFRL